AQAFFAPGGHRVVEPDALEVAAIAALARIGDDDVVERALLGAAAGKSNDDHDGTILEWWCSPYQGTREAGLNGFSRVAHGARATRFSTKSDTPAPATT